MSFIPYNLERDFLRGRATYRTFQTGIGGQSVLNVPENATIIIFGYEFSPAGGGFVFSDEVDIPNRPYPTSAVMRPFETQQISFYTGAAFFPFIHHVDIKQGSYVRGFDPVSGSTTAANKLQSVDNTPIVRNCYIVSDRATAITVGLIGELDSSFIGEVPATAKTPKYLTFGGSGKEQNIFTGVGGSFSPFVQPTPRDFEEYNLGSLPPNYQDQAFSVSTAAGGLIEPSSYINSEVGAVYRDYAACHYFLNVHYALYNEKLK